MTSVRQIAVEDALGRFRPPGRPRPAPRRGTARRRRGTRSATPPRPAPPRRAVAVLRIYDGLDDESIARPMPIRRRTEPAPLDHRLAVTVRRRGRRHPPAEPVDRAARRERRRVRSTTACRPPPRGPHRVRSTRPGTRPEHGGGSSRYWVGAGVVAVVLVGLLGGHFDPALPTPTTRAQELRTGLTVNGAVVERRGDFSSCRVGRSGRGTWGHAAPACRRNRSGAGRRRARHRSPGDRRPPPGRHRRPGHPPWRPGAAQRRSGSRSCARGRRGGRSADRGRHRVGARLPWRRRPGRASLSCSPRWPTRRPRPVWR